MVLKVKVSPELVAGDVDEGYGKLADAFRRNMTSGQEIGAAVAVYHNGAKVVDLWGGYRNGITKEPWQEDTMVQVFSTTKGVSSLAVAVAASKGYLDYDARVVDYWPEFAQAGKESVTVRQLLSHQAGLSALDRPLTLEDLADLAKISAKISKQSEDEWLAWEKVSVRLTQKDQAQQMSDKGAYPIMDKMIDFMHDTIKKIDSKPNYREWVREDLVTGQ